MTKSLDLGCGPEPKNPFDADELFGIDVFQDLQRNIRRADLVVEPIPYEDETFDFVSAHDFLEHVPRIVYAPRRRNAFVELMNEIWRVLKPGGLFLSLTPAYPHGAAFRDPTHVNILTEETFPLYFDETQRWAACYGFSGAFRITRQEWHGPHLLTILQKTAVPGANEGTAAAPEPKPLSIVELNYRLYDNDPGRDISDPEIVRLHESWFREDTAGFWRYARMMEPVFQCMLYAREDTWLTVGDGHYGIDALKMKMRGYKHVLPTDITEVLLKVAKERGLIDDYRIENAEDLSFADESFDYVLCKESYHHFPRPMLALYEMLRVARKAVVLIEPQDPYADYPLTGQPSIAGYETIGNYIYTLSRRELEKVALGLDLPALATKNIVDIYFEGVEYVPASADEPQFLDLVNQVTAMEEACRQMQAKPNVLIAVIFKERPTQDIVDSFLAVGNGWKITSYPGNPYIQREKNQEG